MLVLPRMGGNLGYDVLCRDKRACLAIYSLGDSTPLSLRVTTVLPGNPAEVKDYRLQGDLIITQAASGGTSKTLRGLFSGTYVIDNQSTPIGGPLRFEVDATYDAGGNVVDVKLTGVNSTKLTVQFEIKTIWEGSPEKVGSRVVYRIVRGRPWYRK